jgi:hypothetical protein
MTAITKPPIWQGWSASAEFAAAAGMTPRAAREAMARCLAGGTWGGHRLEVAKVPSPGGFAYLVKSSSLPTEMQKRLGVVQGPVNNPLPAAQSDFEPLVSPKTQVRLALMDPVLATAPGSPERSAAIASAAASGRISAMTVRRWLVRHEELGVVGLACKRRADAGAGRAIAWLALDQRLRAAGLTDQEIRDLAERIRGHVRGLLASTSASSAMIAHACIGFVAQQLRAAGASVSQDDLIAACRPSAEFVRAERQARLPAGSRPSTSRASGVTGPT